MRPGSAGRSALFVLLSFAVLWSAGCATAARAPAWADGPEETDPTTRVVVDNQSEWSLRVYALVGGAQHYLGSLDGFSKATFELPEGARSTADFRLAARAAGPRSNYYSNTVLVEEGDTVRWTVMRSFTQTRGAIQVL